MGANKTGKIGSVTTEEKEMKQNLTSNLPSSVIKKIKEKAVMENISPSKVAENAIREYLGIKETWRDEIYQELIKLIENNPSIPNNMVKAYDDDDLNPQNPMHNPLFSKYIIIKSKHSKIRYYIAIKRTEIKVGVYRITSSIKLRNPFETFLQNNQQILNAENIKIVKKNRYIAGIYSERISRNRQASSAVYLQGKLFTLFNLVENNF